jgi:hypothetical protein
MTTATVATTVLCPTRQNFASRSVRAPVALRCAAPSSNIHSTTFVQSIANCQLKLELVDAFSIHCRSLFITAVCHRRWCCVQLMKSGLLDEKVIVPYKRNRMVMFNSVCTIENTLAPVQSQSAKFT